MKEIIKRFIQEQLSEVFLDEKKLNEAYTEIRNQTKKKEIPLKSFFMETSNVQRGVEDKTIKMFDFLSEEEKAELEAEREYSNNYEKENTNFLLDEFKPREDISDELVNIINSSTNLWAVIPRDSEKALSEFLKFNYLPTNEAVEIVKDIGYTLIPMSFNSVKDVLKKKIGYGGPLNSTLSNIGNGRLKRELALQSVMFSGKNVANNKEGFFKETSGVYVAYLSNFKEYDAIRAVNQIKNHFKKLGYDDFKFEEGFLENYLYRATYKSESLGEKIASDIGLEGFDVDVKIYFQTSDFGLSSVQITPVLELKQYDEKSKLISNNILLSKTKGMNHNLTEVDDKTWVKTISDSIASAEVTVSLINKAEKEVINNPFNCITNVLEDIQVSKNEAIEDVIDCFMFDKGLVCSAKDIYILACELISLDSKSNIYSSVVQHEKLNKILKNKKFSSYDRA